MRLLSQKEVVLILISNNWCCRSQTTKNNTMYRELSDDEDFDELNAVQFRVKSRSQPSAADDPADLMGGASPEKGPGQEAPPAEAEEEPEEEEEYEVERILNKRIKKGKVEYLVKWKGK